LTFQNGDSLEYLSTLMGTGWRQIYVSFESMNYILKENVNKKADFSKPVTLHWEFASNEAVSGEIKLKNLILGDDNFD
jgi:hypothetical protein